MRLPCVSRSFSSDSLGSGRLSVCWLLMFAVAVLRGVPDIGLNKFVKLSKLKKQAISKIFARAHRPGRASVVV